MTRTSEKMQFRLRTREEERTQFRKLEEICPTDQFDYAFSGNRTIFYLYNENKELLAKRISTINILLDCVTCTYEVTELGWKAL